MCSAESLGYNDEMSHMAKPTIIGKIQLCLGIRPVWSKHSLHALHWYSYLRSTVRLEICPGWSEEHIEFLLVLLSFGSNLDSFLRLSIWTIEFVTNKRKYLHLSLFQETQPKGELQLGVTDRSQLGNASPYNICNQLRVGQACASTSRIRAFVVRMQRKHLKQ